MMPSLWYREGRVVARLSMRITCFFRLPSSLLVFPDGLAGSRAFLKHDGKIASIARPVRREGQLTLEIATSEHAKPVGVANGEVAKRQAAGTWPLTKLKVPSRSIGEKKVQYSDHGASDCSSSWRRRGKLAVLGFHLAVDAVARWQHIAEMLDASAREEAFAAHQSRSTISSMSYRPVSHMNLFGPLRRDLESSGIGVAMGLRLHAERAASWQYFLWQAFQLPCRCRRPKTQLPREPSVLTGH